jgi:hypothetical protein
MKARDADTNDALFAGHAGDLLTEDRGQRKPLKTWRQTDALRAMCEHPSIARARRQHETAYERSWRC